MTTQDQDRALEELRTANEELSTVNQELQDRNEQLTRSREDFGNLVSSAEIPFIIVTEKLTIRRIGPTAGKYLNVRGGDLGRPLGDINLRLELPNLESSLRQVMETGQLWEKEVQDAEGCWKLLRIRPYRTASDRIEGAVLNLIDIDRLKQSMAEVERAYRYALDIVESVKVPLLVLDPEFRVETANPAFYQKFQASPADTEGKKIFRLGAGQWDHPDLQKLLDQILPKSRQVDDFPVQFDFPVLGERRMLVSARSMAAREPRILLSIEDITDRLNMEEDLRRAKQRAEAASEAKSEFLANMSHEIRTPMTVILGAIEHLQTTALDKTQTHCLELAETAGKALLDLIGDILDFSKIEARRLVLEQRAFEVRDCVGEAVGILRKTAERNALELRLEIADEVPQVVVGDQNRLRQVLTNLIGNAIKFTELGSVKVRVELAEAPAKHSGRELLFTVSDTGCGIPESHMERLFKSFSQVDASITRRFGGSGLGLAICKGIVERMGGRLRVESEEGRGSSFFFTMPIVTENPQRSQPPSPAETKPDRSTTSSCRVLLAEDNPIIQKVMRIILNHEHWEGTIVADGAAAIAAWKEREFDLILMDLAMEGMDGLTATRHIRGLEAAGKHIPIIALTANALEKTRQDCLDAGMDDIRVKPLRAEALRELIRQYCKLEAPPSGA